MNFKQFTIQKAAILFLITITLFSCKKNDEEIPEIPVKRKGMYILNEGGFNQNNSSISYYDYESKGFVTDIFKQANSRDLGDTGNDIQIYGSKMYVIVHASNTVEVLNFKTAKSIKQLIFTNNGAPRQPRFIVFNKNKAFISSYDGTVAVLDTASLTIDKYINVGRNPEKMVVANNKLYVTNSGGLDYPNYDNTVSVIDLNTLMEIKKITVDINPREIAADTYGDIYVKSEGNYDNVGPALTVINSSTDIIKTKLTNFNGRNIVIDGDLAYFTLDNGAKVFDVKTETVVKEQFVTDGTNITYAYGLAVDNVNGEIFITDAKNFASNGEVFCFDKNGKKLYSLTVGLLPNNIIFINK